MAYVDWTPDLSVGVETIDKQHQRWIELLNDFAAAVTSGHARDRLFDTLTEVVEYARTHFAYEEDVLETSGYPGFSAHRAIHQKFAAEAEAMLADLKAGKWLSTTTVLSKQKDWLINHIRKVDQQYAPHLRARKAA